MRHEGLSRPTELGKEVSYGSTGTDKRGKEAMMMASPSMANMTSQPSRTEVLTMGYLLCSLPR